VYANLGEGGCLYTCEATTECPDDTWPVITPDCFSCGAELANGLIDQGDCTGDRRESTRCMGEETVYDEYEKTERYNETEATADNIGIIDGSLIIYGFLGWDPSALHACSDGDSTGHDIDWYRWEMDDCSTPVAVAVASLGGNMDLFAVLETGGTEYEITSEQGHRDPTIVPRLEGESTLWIRCFSGQPEDYMIQIVTSMEPRSPYDMAE
jgi:hypothetical protein